MNTENIQYIKEQFEMNGNLFSKLTEEILEKNDIKNISIISEKTFDAVMVITHNNKEKESIKGADNMVSRLTEIINK